MANYRKDENSNQFNKSSAKQNAKKFQEEFASEFETTTGQNDLAKPEMFTVKKERVGKRTAEDLPSKPE